MHIVEIPIDDIIVAQRQRQDYGDLSQLADSIKRFGVIQPIQVDSVGRLLLGGRRLAAAKLAGVKTVTIIKRFDVSSPLLFKEIELEENLNRLDLSPQEELRAREELARLREVQAKFSGQKFNESNVAKEIDIARSTLSKDRAVFAAMMEMPQLKDLESKKAIWSRYRQLKIQEILREKARRATEGMKSQFILGQCPDALKQIPSNSIDLIVCDPPFGVNISMSMMAEKSGEAMSLTGYSDIPIDVQQMIEGTASELYRVLSPGSHVYMFCAALQIHYIHKSFVAAGFTVDPAPIVWVKPTSIQLNPYEQWSHCVEYCVWGFKGPRRNPMSEVSPRDVLEFPVPHDKVHIAQKPIALLRKLIELSSVPGHLVLDCFCGSGSTLVAAVESGRRFLGIDMNQNCLDISIARVGDAMKAMAVQNIPDDIEEDSPEQEEGVAL